MVVKWTAPLSSPWTSLVIGADLLCSEPQNALVPLSDLGLSGAQFLLAEQAPYILLMRKTDRSGGRGNKWPFLAKQEMLDVVAVLLLQHNLLKHV